MRNILLTILLCATFVASADERGVARLDRVSQNYSSLGNYSIEFKLRVADALQSGRVAVAGNNMYMRVADTEVYILDSLRYEVNASTKEITIDRNEFYKNNLMNPLVGIGEMARDYNVDEMSQDGRIVIRLTPKVNGDVLYLHLTADGTAIESIKYGVGEGALTIEASRPQKSGVPIPKFDIQRYKGYEMIDFR